MYTIVTPETETVVLADFGHSEIGRSVGLDLEDCVEEDDDEWDEGTPQGIIEITESQFRALVILARKEGWDVG